MKLAPARQAAFAALLAVERGAWSAESLAAKSTQLEARDAGLASDIVFGTLRHKGEVDAVIAHFSRVSIDKLDPPVRIALEIALYQMRFLNRVPAHAAVNDSVELVRRAGKSSAAALVNAILHKALRRAIDVPESESTPHWLLDRWTAQYGQPLAEAIAHASLKPPGAYLAVAAPGQPPLGRSPRTCRAVLFFPREIPMSFASRTSAHESVVPLLDLKPGMSFLDVCAAPGNKTAQALESGVHAVACELHESRARGLKSLGVPVLVPDATRPLPFGVRFDRILVDAPCSGTGTLARNPEIKWR